MKADQKESKGKIGWKKLKKLLLQQKIINPSKLLSCPLLERKINHLQNYKQVTYSYKQVFVNTYEQSYVKVTFQNLNENNSHEIDSTGTWIWQAQEVLSYYILVAQATNKYQDIIQLGAGSSGLASLFSYKIFNPRNLHITDGKMENLKNIEKSFNLNDISIKNQNCVSIYQLQWSSQIKIEVKFDLVLVSDCLFFEDFHNDLISTIAKLMKQNGKCILVNPSRGESMSRFIKLATLRGYQCRFIEFDDINYTNWNETIKKLKDYDQSCHNFYIIQLKY